MTLRTMGAWVHFGLRHKIPQRGMSEIAALSSKWLPNAALSAAAKAAATAATAAKK